MSDAATMRTTVDLDANVLLAAKELAAARRVTLGRLVSDLMRQALASPASSARKRNGVPLLPRLPADSPLITMKTVNELRDND